MLQSTQMEDIRKQTTFLSFKFAIIKQKNDVNHLKFPTYVIKFQEDGFLSRFRNVAVETCRFIH